MKVAVVGIQAMGKSHLAAARACKAVSEVAGCDIDEEARRRVGDEFGIPMFAGVAEMLREFRPKVVIVVTGPNRHAEVIRASLEAGAAIFTEKPICSSLRESAELVAMAERRGLAMQVGFEIRYCGFMLAIQSLLAEGVLGRLSHVGLTQFSGPHRAGYMTRERTGGVFYEKLCHQIDTFRYLLGEPKRAMAIASPRVMGHYGVEDNVMAVFEFAGGGLGTIQFDTRRAAQIDGTSATEREFEGREAGHFYEFTFTGDKGAAIFDAWTECVDVVRFNHRGDHKSEFVRRIRASDFGTATYAVAEQDGDFLERVARRQPPRFPARDALETMKWVEVAEQSLRSGGRWMGIDGIEQTGS